MVIPKQFEGLEDLEAMLLTSMLGSLVALKDGLISFKQAESYWFSDITVDLLTQLGMNEEVIEITCQAIQLKSIKDDSFQQQIVHLITKTQNLLGSYYTEYEHENSTGLVS